MDLTTLMLIAWGLTNLYVWGRVFLDRRQDYRDFHDARAWRTMIAGFALLLVAIAASTAIVTALLVPPGTGIRAFAVYTALAAFTAAGFYSRDENRRRDNGHTTAGAVLARRHGDRDGR